MRAADMVEICLDARSLGLTEARHAGPTTVRLPLADPWKQRAATGSGPVELIPRQKLCPPVTPWKGIDFSKIQSRSSKHSIRASVALGGHQGGEMIRQIDGVGRVEDSLPCSVAGRDRNKLMRCSA